MVTSNTGRARSERAVIAFLAFIAVLMAFGIDVALPAFDEMEVDFGFEARGLSPAITGTAYFAGMAAGQLFYGVLADRFGRQKMLLVGISVYAIGALAAARAQNLEILLAARFIWGLGASGPLVLRLAIARDLFDGERMARVVSTVTAVFLIGPILIPFAGEAILLIGSWRVVFASSIVLAVIAFGWTLVFGETLAEENRRPIRFAPFADAFRTVARTPATRWGITAIVFYEATFLIWLGSAQPVLDTVYGRDTQFTLFFGASGIGMAIALVINNRLLERCGMRYMARLSAIAFVAVTTVGLVVALATDGVPSVWLWFGWALLANMFNMVILTMATTIALDPMGDKAGTASSLLGLAQLGGGAVLAALVDSRIDKTVTPMLAGALAFGGLGLASILLAIRPPGTGISRHAPTQSVLAT